MKYFKIFLVFFIFLLFHQKAYSKIEVDANYIILQDHLSGEILYEKNADGRIYPASMTKIMTTIIVFDLLKNGEVSLDEKITDTKYRLSVGPFKNFNALKSIYISLNNLGFEGINIYRGQE